MAARALEFESKRGRGIQSSAAAALEVWGNWYIMRTSHEFGWASHWAVMNYFGLFVAGHKILFDTPERVRRVDIAIGTLPALLREALALGYWWHRDMKGRPITDAMRANAMDLASTSQYGEVLRTAKLCAEKALDLLDLRRKSATLV
jgi:hypothetical protein